MKEFKHLVGLNFDDKDNKLYTEITAMLDISLEYLVSFWYIGSAQNDKKKDYLFTGEDLCLYVEDADVEGIGTKGGAEVEGAILNVYGNYETGKSKDDITVKLV